jgi:hypothetical protein
MGIERKTDRYDGEKGIQWRERYTKMRDRERSNEE